MLFLEVFLFSAIIFATFLSGYLIIQNKNTITRKFMPYMISISTGLFLGIGFFEFIPHTYKHQHSFTSLLVFLGLILVIVSEKYLAPLLNTSSQQSCQAHHTHNSHTHNQNLSKDKSTKPLLSYFSACSSIGCIVVCAFFDGIKVPAAFQLQNSAAMLVGVGMILHIIPEGALVASIGIASGFSKKSILKNLGLVCFALIVGGILSAFAFNTLTLEKYVFPVATGVLLYTAIGHLLPVAIKSKFGWLGVSLGAFIIFVFSA